MIREHEIEQPKADNLQIVAYPQQSFETLMIDVDNTLYERSDEYEQHRQEIQFEALVELTGVSPDKIGEVVSNIESEIIMDQQDQGYNTRITSTEIVKRLGIDEEKWDKVRSSRITPEKFIPQNPQVSKLLASLDNNYNLILTSNSPSTVVKKVLSAIGSNNSDIQRYQLFTTDIANTTKPNPNFYTSLKDTYNIDFSSTLSIGDNFNNDGEMPVELGMGAVIVNHPSEINLAVDYVNKAKSAETFSYDNFAINHASSSSFVSLIGITSRAGSGKTTFSDKLAMAFIKNVPHTDAYIFHSDNFFKLSSSERALWLEDPNITEAERTIRRDQATWWDLPKMRSQINSVLENEDTADVIARHLKSESCDSQKPHLHKRIILVEGVPIPSLHPLIPFEKIFYLYTHPMIRKRRIFERDSYKRTPQQLEDRFTITQDFENKLFGQLSFPANKSYVLDFTKPDDIVFLPNNIPLR